MKRLKTEKKRLIVGIIAVFLIVTMIFGMVAPFVYGADFTQQSKSISIQANIGFDGNIKISNTAPFQITLKNNSDSDFKGKLEIYVLNKYDNSTLQDDDLKKNKHYNVFEEDVELAPKSEKEFDFKINIDIIQRDIEIKVKDYKGNKIESEIYDINTHKSDKLWVGMISDNPESISYLKPQYYDVESETFLMDNKTFPENKYVLSNFNMIIINNFNINLFSELQKKILYDWIYSGGFLLIGAGNYQQEINEQFKDEKFKNVRSIENIINLNKEADNEADTFLYNNTEIKQFGKGHLIIHKFDLSQEELLNSLAFQDELINQYIQSTSVKKNNSFDVIYYCTRFLNFSNEYKIILIIIAVYFYSILIGPILYAVLKKKDKREYAIFIIPIISLSFTFIIYILSFNTIYKRAIASSVSYLDLDKNFNNNLDMEIGLNLSSPEKGTIKMEFNNDLFLKSINSDNDIQSEYKNEILSKVEINDKMSITKYDSQKWNSNLIKLMKNVNIQGNIDLNLYIENKTVKGTITNNTGYDLKDIVMGVGGVYYKYESLKNGEEINIENSNMKFILNDMDYSNDKYSKILTDGNRYIKPKNIDSDRFYELELEQDIVSGIISSELNAQQLQFILVAFNDDETMSEEIITNNKKTTVKNKNVLKISKIFDMSEFKTVIPFGIIRAQVLNTIDYYNKNSYDIKVNDIEIYTKDTKEDIEIKFDIPENINIDSFKIEWASSEGKGKIYNYASKSWEDISQIEYSANKENYINDYNEIHLMLENNEDTNEYILLPEIEIKLNN